MNYFWSLLCCLFTSSLIAQTNVKGQVIDFDSAIPIAFASITYNSSSISADWEGKFNLTVEDPKLPIKINYPGYLEKIAYPSALSAIITVKLIPNIMNFINVLIYLCKAFTIPGFQSWDSENISSSKFLLFTSGLSFCLIYFNK